MATPHRIPHNSQVGLISTLVLDNSQYYLTRVDTVTAPWTVRADDPGKNSAANSHTWLSSRIGRVTDPAAAARVVPALHGPLGKSSK